MRLLAELRRRNVIRMAGLYLVGAWLITQVSSTILPLFEAPLWLPRTVVILLAIGFVPALVFAWVFELTPQGLRREGAVVDDPAFAPATARRLDRAIIVILALALAYFALDKFVLAPRRATAPLAPSPESTRGVAVRNSIAVLPLANEGGNADEQYFSDGLSEDLITALSQFSGLKVIGRTSSFQFRDGHADSRAIGEKLGVAHLLAGSVRRVGDVVRISAELVNASDGSTLWSQRYDRPYKDLFKLQDEITATVAAELKAKLVADGSAAPQSDRPPGGSLDAYNAYLRGMFDRARDDEAGYRSAVEHFTEATVADPRYAQAFAACALSKASLAAGYLAGDDLLRTLAEARTAADKALTLEPDNAMGHRARALLYLLGDRAWRDAEAEYRQALKLAPNDPANDIEYSRVLATLGRLDEAVAAARRALVTDVLNAEAHYNLALFLIGQGRYDDAERAARRALELQPTSNFAGWALATVQLQRGDVAAALASIQKMPLGPWRDTLVALSAQLGADRAAADAALKKLIAEQAEWGAYQIAETYAVRKEPDRLFEWLARAWDNHDAGVGLTLYDAYLAPYRSDPRFAAFCAKAGLPTPQDVVSAAPAGS
jgi:TolB-like protein/Tfp pilus assembly protein PilF